jgi:uncharacterized protein YydD (DUF2326 family)
MIRRLYAENLSKFKPLTFKDGLNVVLAEKSPGATDRHTRNRAGKSSILDIVHFLLGSKGDRKSIFQNPALADARFGMEFDLGGSFTRVERSCAQGAPPSGRGRASSPIFVAGDFASWPIPPAPKDGGGLLSNENWKHVLGKLMFDLDEFEGTWGPSFRSLLSYFVRRDREGGMALPMMNWRQQRLADQQVNVSFLVGLDWSIPSEWQRVRDRENTLEQLKKSLADGALGSVIGTAAALKSDLIVAQARVRRLRSSVDSFKVVEQYHELEREASALTTQVSDLSDQNVIDKRYVAELETTTVREPAPAPKDLEALYKAAGVLLPDLVKKRFDAVSAFHDSVIKNRRSYLRSEIESARNRIVARDAEKAKLDGRRSDVMRILRSSGALDHFVVLQAELSKAEAAAEAVKQRHEAAEALETGDLKLKVERAHLVERLRQDYTEQAQAIEDAVLTFRDISAQLYEDDQAGTLTITPTDNGPIFDPHISGEKSKGVNNMRIFCFDMMLMLLSLRRGRSPGFLVHDSHLFDGVDERQVGKAIALGAALAKEHSFQYIVTMNTDAIPREVPAGFKLDDFALPVRLTDASEDGGLFGFRFD